MEKFTSSIRLDSIRKLSNIVFIENHTRNEDIYKRNFFSWILLGLSISFNRLDVEFKGKTIL